MIVSFSGQIYFFLGEGWRCNRNPRLELNIVYFVAAFLFSYATFFNVLLSLGVIGFKFNLLYAKCQYSIRST